MMPHDKLPTPSPDPEFGTSQENRCAPEINDHHPLHSYFHGVQVAERFADMAYLSNVASVLRDRIPCGTHTKGYIHYPDSFTGRDVMTAIQSFIPRHLCNAPNLAALQISQSLYSQTLFRNLEWDNPLFQDSTQELYAFLPEYRPYGKKLESKHLQRPSGVITILTRCYFPSCEAEGRCYAPRCPRKDLAQLSNDSAESDAVEPEELEDIIPDDVLRSLSENELNRRRIIHKLIKNEERYVRDLDILSSAFLSLLYEAFMLPVDKSLLDHIVSLGNFHRRLLSALYARRREDNSNLQSIGDILLEASCDFRSVYAAYLGFLPSAEEQAIHEMENPDFRFFIELCDRTISKRLPLRLSFHQYLRRPMDHLETYCLYLDALLSLPPNPDGTDLRLREAQTSLSTALDTAMVCYFQASGFPSRGRYLWDWDALVSQSVKEGIGKRERLRQCIIFELINSEMYIVKALGKIKNLYITPLRTANPPIIPPLCLDQFIKDVFGNYEQVLRYHSNILSQLLEAQKREHPLLDISSISAPYLSLSGAFREAYMEYIPNHIHAKWKIEREMDVNPSFRAFIEDRTRLLDADRLCMGSFLGRPNGRLRKLGMMFGRFEEETRGLEMERETTGSDEVSEGVTDLRKVLEILRSVGKEIEPLVQAAKEKVELERCDVGLVFSREGSVDFELLNGKRRLLHQGKLFHALTEWSRWMYHVVLFDHYLVMTRPKVKYGVTKYLVQYRVRLSLPHLHVGLRGSDIEGNAADPTGPALRQEFQPCPLLMQRNAHRHYPTWCKLPQISFTQAVTTTALPPDISEDSHVPPDINRDSHLVYPFTIQTRGSRGGSWRLCAASLYEREEWKRQLEEAVKLRRVRREGRVFEMRMMFGGGAVFEHGQGQGKGELDWAGPGRISCSAPFDCYGQQFLAVGCAQGVWVGSPDGLFPMRRVLDVTTVKQCQVLQDLGVFLVLADKSLLAYRLDVLVQPSSPTALAQSHSYPQKVSLREVQCFTSRILEGRIVVYVTKKGRESVVHVVEPVVDRINETSNVVTPKTATGLSRILGVGRTKPSQWFRICKTFCGPFVALDIQFLGLQGKIAIRSERHFYILDLTQSPKPVLMPQLTEDLALARRCALAQPIAVFLYTEDEYLMCFDEFGIFLDQDGCPSQRRERNIIEWEGAAKRAVLLLPYVILFDNTFVEVRHLETGGLVQVLTGVGIECIWAESDLPGRVSETCIHLAIDAEWSMFEDVRLEGRIEQRIYELLCIP
ncbi:uncharacterized protein LACBIDRAFT_300387 [Laccaria bicolor S238N-H82]|uniref:Predicted protein n=1 Tax=Laccaria bicolor (strain S238N-H82 / ATCC MYA-4686) TaxID=486041 RepID=B0DGM8_LACBS|nr:uncharacterized protein LACBIDRAFT_300387 [Laccaria bicolor S238N-H82]EDR06179.1 predicted protein [Laccaria bicolor S238N-H82]|eukprot:XP_001883040.1 predicted protein [Laccaria bicolor S238N-H82]